MEFNSIIKQECVKTEHVETMDFKQEETTIFKTEIDDDTFDHGPLPGDNLNAPAAPEQTQARQLETAMTQMNEFIEYGC